MGSREDIQQAGVQYILDTTIDALIRDPTKKFIYVEIAFFSRWWEEQTPETQAAVRQLVNEGRLEFVNGGWCMSDEAAEHYQDSVHNMEIGHRFLLDNFGAKGIPTTGWHIDPFGHASSQASVFSQIGFNGFFFARIDYQDYQQRTKDKTLEVVWRSSRSLGSKSDMFTHMMYGSTYCYGGLGGFAWEFGDDPIQDDPDLFDMNVKDKADDFVNQMRNHLNMYRTTEILVAFGCDFQFMNAQINFKNMDKLMKYINSHSEYNTKLFYSTPSMYLEALNSKNLTWHVKNDDFFPYADNAHSYWTGYFSSRSALKGYIRVTSAWLRFAQLFTSLVPSTYLTPTIKSSLLTLEKAQGVNQHHDAVSGTEKQHVANDYAKRLSIGSTLVASDISAILSKVVAKGAAGPSFSFCPLLNESICPALDALSSLAPGQVIPVVAYNSLSWARVEVLRLPVPAGNFRVLNSSGLPVLSETFTEFNNLRYIYFKAELPAQGFNTFFVTKSSETEKDSDKKVNAPNTIENEYLSVTFDPTSGLLSTITDKRSGTTAKVSQQIMWYNPVTSGQASGAYIFRPQGPATALTGTPKVSYQQGNIVQEALQEFPQSWVKQTFRLFQGEPYLQVQANVGPIDVSDGIGKEIISRFSTDFNTQKTFWTDSQGLELQKRIKDFRPDWNLTITEPIASNFYPVDAIISIQDTTKSLQFSILTDRSRGGTSLSEGQVETMVHRRLLVDDGRGVGEPLDETTQIYATDRILFDTIPNAAKGYRTQAQFQANPVNFFFGGATTVSDWSKYVLANSFISQPLPENLYLQTLRPILYPQSSNSYILRFHHLYAVGEDAKLSQPVTLNVQNLFSKKITSIEETNLTGVTPISQVKRMQWKTDSEDTKSEKAKVEGPFDITINPMDIRTFIVTFDS
eukprot:TRINITY_DN3519_c0_g1_i4.p1 TRINITY_DN3519_c0_g1~~TRINITY_DN3519_c0_g1_i4.p1  ORF type:complete len:964 (+),score=220.79 TRINITY_DN3519_c0_g1_i4:163-2892(+)